MPSTRGWLVLALGLMASCGGVATSSDGEPRAAADAAPTGDETGCAGAPAEDPGCDGAGGERPLAAYARLHTACNLSVAVNRRGAPVSIDCHIK